MPFSPFAVLKNWGKIFKKTSCCYTSTEVGPGSGIYNWSFGSCGRGGGFANSLHLNLLLVQLLRANKFILIS